MKATKENSFRQFGLIATLLVMAVIGVIGSRLIPNPSVEAASPDFFLSDSPSSQNVAPGGATEYFETVSGTYGFNSTVYLTVSGLPHGATASFSPSSLKTGTSRLTITCGKTTPSGSYTLTVTGKCGSKVKTRTIYCHVAPSCPTPTPPPPVSGCKP
jgi:hypothetical protein